MAPLTRTTQSASKIITATTELLEIRRASEITITDITQRAGVTRPTFYSTFGDLPTAFAKAAAIRLAHALDGMTLAELEGSTYTEKFTLGIRIIIERIAEHEDFYKNVVSGHGGRNIQAAMIEQTARGIRANTQIMAALEAGPLPADFVIGVLAAGVSWTTVEWIIADERESIDQLILQIRDFLTYSVFGGLGNADELLDLDEI